MKDKIERMIRNSIDAKERLLSREAGNIEKAVRAITGAYKAGAKLIVFGNGGSAADSQHIAAEFVGRFKKERRAFPAIALTTDTSILTAIANDYGYESVFTRQVEAFGNKGDVALGISTSGKSKNVISALQKARSLGMVTIGLTGSGIGTMGKTCDIVIAAGSEDTPRIQECHGMVIHIICALVEEALCGEK